MSSYGSMSPTDEGFDRYEPPFYCPPHPQHGSPLESGVFWQTAEHHDYELIEGYDNSNYIGRSYGYDDMMSSGDPYDGYHQQTVHMGYTQNIPLECGVAGERAAPFVRVVKRRHTANRKERRRTQSINTAFSDLRDCIPNVPPDTKLSKSQKKERRQTANINNAFTDLRDRIPNVPADTKLSKIKTLRLATSYISYLMRVLAGEGEPAGGFRAELQPAPRRHRQDTHQTQQPTTESKRTKGRTGWPQHVWALELNSEPNLQT